MLCFLHRQTSRAVCAGVQPGPHPPALATAFPV
jgi:hypothetical protein